MTWEAAATGKRGRQPDYGDVAIQTCLTMKGLFGIALRQTTGFVESLLRLIGLGWDVPDFSTLSRRLSARDFDRQVAEFRVGVVVPNGFTALGIPVTKAVA